MIIWILFRPYSIGQYTSQCVLPIQRSKLASFQESSEVYKNVFPAYKLVDFSGHVLLICLAWLLLLEGLYSALIGFYRPLAFSQENVFVGLVSTTFLLCLFVSVANILRIKKITDTVYYFFVYHGIQITTYIAYIGFLIINSELSTSTDFIWYAGSLLGMMVGSFYRIVFRSSPLESIMICVGLSRSILPYVDLEYPNALPARKLRQTEVTFSGLSFICFVFICILVFILALLLRYFVILSESINSGYQSSIAQFLVLASLSLAFFIIMTARVDDWVRGYQYCEKRPDNTGHWLVPQVTAIRFNRVVDELERQLALDWKKGLENCIYVVNYSFQSVYVAWMIHKKLTEDLKDKSFEIVSELFNDSKYEKLLGLLQLFRQRPNENEYLALLRGFIYTLNTQNRISTKQSIPDEPLSKHQVDQTIAVFLHLKQKKTSKVLEILARIQKDNKSAEELYQLVKVIDVLLKPEDIITKAPLKISRRPLKPQYPEMWESLESIRHFIRFSWLHRLHKDERSEVIENSAKQTLKDASQLLSDKTQPITILLREQAHSWEENLNFGISGEVPDFEPIPNPFQFMEPLRNPSSFAAERKSTFNKIKDAWQPGHFQPIMLYGQRQVGKTSIIFNAKAKQESLGVDVTIVYINMQFLESRATQTQLLMAICEEIYDELAERWPSFIEHPPSLDELRLRPNQVFQRYVKKVCNTLSSIGLVIVLDEFDHIENIIGDLQIHDNLLQFLWEISQTISNLGFAFITVETPSEVRDKFANPFSKGLNPIRVEYLSSGDAERLLRNPNQGFLPYFLNDAIERIHELTDGQPYLVQVLGYCLIEKLNQQLENSKTSNPRPTINRRDVEALLTDSNVMRRCDIYFDNIEQELTTASAVRGTPPTTGDPNWLITLHTLARNRNGFTEDELLSLNATKESLDLLNDHNIIVKKEGVTNVYWQIRVELLRRRLMLAGRKESKDSSKNFEQAFCSIKSESKLSQEQLILHNPSGRWIVEDDLDKTGTIERSRCAIWHKEIPPSLENTIGFIGHFATQNIAIGVQILNHAVNSLRDLGCRLVVGPVDSNVFGHFGYRLPYDKDGITPRYPSFYLEPECPPHDWLNIWERSGFYFATHYVSVLAELPTHYIPASELLNSRYRRISIRAIDINNLEQELGRIYDLLNSNHVNNNAMLPIQREEFIALHKTIQDRMEPVLTLVAEQDGTLVGFVIAIHDSLEIKTGIEDSTVLIKIVEIRPEFRTMQLDVLLIDQCHRLAETFGKKWAIHTFMPESGYERERSKLFAATLYHKYVTYIQTINPL